MNIRKIFMSAALLAGCFTASAQQPQAAEVQPQAAAQSADAFVPHWYVQAQLGGQYTLGEVDFSDLLSGNAQAAVGYNFTPVWGLRLAFDFWQSKGGTNLNYLGMGTRTWKYKYVAPTLDVTCDLTNWILGYKADRVCNFGLLAGLGANIGWDNGSAAAVQQQIFATGGDLIDPAHQMSLLWSGTKTRFVGRFGAYLDFKVSRRVSLGMELNCNATSDHYNSKKAENADWYFNALAGVKVRLGKLAPKKAAEPIIIEKIVEKIVEKPVEKPVEKEVVKEPEAPKREPLRRDIFFTLRGSEVSRTEMVKVEDVVTYLNKYPDAKVSVTGYADKGTGNAKLNIGYALRRAEVIANLLANRFGISRSRIAVDSKGDTVQPYEQNDLNRVTICIAE